VFDSAGYRSVHYGVLNVQITIDNCRFYNGTAYQHGGGLAIRATHFNHDRSWFVVKVSDSGFFGHIGGGMSYKVQGSGRYRTEYSYSTEYSFIVQIWNSQLHTNVAENGGGLQIEATSHTIFPTHKFKVFYNISISLCNFSRNVANERGGSVDIACGHDEDVEASTLEFEVGWNLISFINCSFSESKAKVGAGMHIHECKRKSDFSGLCVFTQTLLQWKYRN